MSWSAFLLSGTDARSKAQSDRPDPSPAVMRVGILLVPDFSLMSYASAVEPLRAANRLSGRELYAWRHITLDAAPVTASNGFAVPADFRIGDEAMAFLGSDDLLLVCAGGNPALFNDRPTLAFIRGLARRGVALGGVSGGPYLLARAGVLTRRRCTIHWEHMPAFTEEFPDLNLTRTLFEIDGDRLTCAGGIAALDMMHALIERDHGRDLAIRVSEWFLQTVTRRGSLPQRMSLRERYGVTSPPLLSALQAMEARLEEPPSRVDLAAVAGVSVRQLERLFAEALQTTIARHSLAIRLDRARRLLRETALPVVEIAVACGFVSAAHFSRSYKARHGHPPRAERYYEKPLPPGTHTQTS